jgi:hypothetical protein
LALLVVAAMIAKATAFEETEEEIPVEWSLVKRRQETEETEAVVAALRQQKVVVTKQVTSRATEVQRHEKVAVKR